MAVLVEAISVIVRLDAIETKVPSGWAGFAELVPNQTLCSDGELVRVGFMHPDDVKVFVETLEGKGLRYLSDGKAVDLVVVDQQRGPLAWAEWLEFGVVPLNPNNVRVQGCRLAESKIDHLVTPPGWSYEESLSRSFGFAAAEDHVELTEIGDGLIQATGPLWPKPMYMGRTSGKRSSDS
jgi:hypothetical protein